MSRWHAFMQLVLARLREFFREPEAVFWVYGFPLILAVALGIAFSGNRPETPDVDIVADPASSDARKMLEILKRGELNVEIHDEKMGRARLKSGKTAFLVVPGAPPKFIYDQARSDSVLARDRVEATLLRGQIGEHALAPEVELVTERGSRYIDFLIPGLVGMNLMGGGLFGIGFVLVDMRMRKLFKRLLATPMRRPDFLLSLFAARLVFLVPEMVVLLLAGFLLFGVPLNGDPFTLTIIILVGSLSFSGLGLLLGCRTEKTETISGLLNLVMLPSWLLSGVFFSSKKFPDAAQPFIQALPLTQLNDSLREVMLEGYSLFDVGWRLGILCAWGLVSYVLALKWFRWR